MLQHTKIDLISSSHRRQALAAADPSTLAKRPPPSPSARPNASYYQHNYQAAVIGNEQSERRVLDTVATKFVHEPSGGRLRHAIPLPGLVVPPPSIAPSPITVNNNNNNNTTSFTSSSPDDLNRVDSGNSSLGTNVDSLSNASTLSGESNTFNSVSLDANSYQEESIEDTYLHLKIYVPEAQSEVSYKFCFRNQINNIAFQFDISCFRTESIARIKEVLIENTPVGQLRHSGLNHGLFSFTIGKFLDEQCSLADYYNVPLDFVRSKQFVEANPARAVISLEFLYKQRFSHGEIMSTLPLGKIFVFGFTFTNLLIFKTKSTASSTKKKRKRSRLLSAIQNGNADKVAKALGSCDPNFVDDSSGETPLSMIASSQLANSAAQQQIIVAIVNGGALLDFRTKEGRTALHSACMQSNFIALKTLLDLGASPNYTDAHGLTPLYYTILYKANPKLTQLLLHEHATHGVVDQHGWQEVHQVRRN